MGSNGRDCCRDHIWHMWLTHWLLIICVGGLWDLYLSWWPPSKICVRPVIFLSATTGKSEIIPMSSVLKKVDKLNLSLSLSLSFRIWGYVLHVEHVSCVKSGSILVNHPFSFLNSSLGLVGGKYYQEIFRCVLFLKQVCSSRLLSPYSLLSYLSFPFSDRVRRDIAFIVPMHRNKPNIIYFWLGCYCSMWWLYFSPGK